MLKTDKKNSSKAFLNNVFSKNSLCSNHVQALKHD